MRASLIVLAGAAALFCFARRSRPYVPDDALIVRVRDALQKVLWHAGSVDVQARRGIIVLHGPVAVAEVRRALRAAWAVPGVRGVENRLTVPKPRQRPRARPV